MPGQSAAHGGNPTPWRIIRLTFTTRHPDRRGEGLLRATIAAARSRYTTPPRMKVILLPRALC